MQKEILSDPKKLVPLLNRKLYEKGDCYSPGTGFCIKKDYKVYLAPAESNPDLLDEDDIFTFNEMLDENGNPSVDVAPTDSSLEPSKYSKLYLHLLEEFSCNCVLLVESQCAKLAGDLYSDSLVFSNVECLTNIILTVTKEKLRACDSLSIPIIPDKQPQEELISDLINALYSNTSTCCCIIKGFGMIFLGDCWKSVRSMLETVKQLLQYELNILQYRIRSDLSQQISGINRQINEIRQQISSDNYNKSSMTITNNTQQFKDDKSAKNLDKISKDETEVEAHVAKESTPKDDGLMSFLNNVDEENINDDLLLDDNEQGEADLIEDTANNELNVSEGTNGKLNNSEMESTKTDATQDTEKIQQPKPVAKTATRRQTRKSTNKKETSDSSPNKNAPETEEKSTNNDSDKNVAEDDKTSAKKPAETIVSKRPTRASARVTTAKSPKPAQTKATEKKSSPSKTLEDKATPNKVSESKSTSSEASENQSTSNTATEGKALEENSQANKETPKKVAGSTSTAKATPKANSKTANANKTPEKVKDSSSKTLTTEKSPNNALAKESVHDKNKPKSNIEKKKDNSPAKEDQSELDLEIDLNPFEQDELFEGIDRSEFEEKEDPAKDGDKPVEDDSCIILDDDDEVEATSSSQNKRSRTSKSPEKGEYKRSRFSYSPEAEKQKKVEDTSFPVKIGENFDYDLIDLTNSGDEDIKIETEANNVIEKVHETKEKAPDEATNQPRGGTFSYEFSQQFLAETTEPFHGFFDATGSNYGTYNTKGDWRNFLTFYEIFQHFNRDYEKLAAEIVKDPSIVINWLEKSNKGTQDELTPFHFRFQSHGNFKFVKKVMLSLGIKIEDDKRKEEKKQRMREKRALERERKEQERLSAEIQEKQEDSSNIPQPEEALKT